MGKHLEVCLYQGVRCPNSDNCGKILRKDLSKHVTQDCVYRIKKCMLNCGQSLPLIEMERHLNKECPKAKIDCKNGCVEKIE